MAGRFIVRVDLPMDVTAVLLCDKGMTVEWLLNRSLLQLQVIIEGKGGGGAVNTSTVSFP